LGSRQAFGGGTANTHIKRPTNPGEKNKAPQNHLQRNGELRTGTLAVKTGPLKKKKTVDAVARRNLQGGNAKWGFEWEELLVHGQDTHGGRAPQGFHPGQGDGDVARGDEVARGRGSGV